MIHVPLAIMISPTAKIADVMSLELLTRIAMLKANVCVRKVTLETNVINVQLVTLVSPTAMIVNVTPMDLSTMNVIPMENVIVRSMCKETNVTQLFLDGTNLLIPKNVIAMKKDLKELNVMTMDTANAVVMLLAINAILVQITFMDFLSATIVDVMSKALLTKTVTLQVESVLVRMTPLLETNAINVLKIISDSLIVKNVLVMLRAQPIHVMPLVLVLVKIKLKVQVVINVSLLTMASLHVKIANVMLKDLKMETAMKRASVLANQRTLLEINAINVLKVIR